jgi:hypothetical protein
MGALFFVVSEVLSAIARAQFLISSISSGYLPFQMLVNITSSNMQFPNGNRLETLLFLAFHPWRLPSILISSFEQSLM